MSRKVIQFIIGLILSFLGVPSKESIIQAICIEFSKSNLVQSSICSTINLFVFISGLLLILEVLIELGFFNFIER